MQVRLAFSVAIHANKEILLLDEVLAVGDANFQVKCYQVFEDLIKEGKTIIFVSHDQGSIQKYSNRVLYLESGKPAFIGGPNEALSQYMISDVIKEKHSDHTLTVESIKDEENQAVNIINNDQEKEQLEVGEIIHESKKIIEIIDVIILNNNGLESKNLIHGETFYINVIYNISTDLYDLIFGITIRDPMKRVLFTTNTYVEKIETGLIKTGQLVVSYEISNYLASGQYELSAAVCDKTQSIFYDWKDGLEFFYVSNPNRILSYGGVELPHKITLKEDIK
jgi:teichoic acid transport system ATP-binding protein